MAILRKVNWAGPCIPEGPIVRRIDRHGSMVRAARPYQMERNRQISQQVEAMQAWYALSRIERYRCRGFDTRFDPARLPQ